MILASDIRSDLRIKLSNLNYPDIHVHVACNGHGGLQTASEIVMASVVIKFELSDLNYSLHTSRASNKLKNVFLCCLTARL